MDRIKGYLHSDGSWWAVRRGMKGPTTVCAITWHPAKPGSVEVHMMQSKMFAVHAEADTKADLIARVRVALVELEGEPVPDAAFSSEKAVKSEKPGRSEKLARGEKTAPKLTVDAVKQALTKLKDIVGGPQDPDKKGIKAVKRILKEFGVAQTPDLKEEQFADAMAMIEKGMPRDAESDGEDF